MPNARRSPLRRLAALGVLCSAAALPLHAAETPVLRVFMRDGTTIAAYGEYARVGDRVVVALPLGDLEDGRPRLQLVSLPADRVDWPRTERYRETVRGAHYAATRGEQDFTAMTAEVASTLNEISRTTDRTRQLELAERARRRLASWGPDHHGYRAREVREIAALLDESISELRAAAGRHDFDLSLVAIVEPPPPEPLLGPPGAADLIAQALAIAERTDDPAERQALYEGAIAYIDRAQGQVDEAALRAARRHAERQLQRERTVDLEYLRLTREVATLARTRAERADVRGVEAVLAMLDERDGRLGGQRPQLVAGIRSAIRQQLDSARRLRLALDRWALRLRSYQSYERLVTAPIAELSTAHEPLEDIRRLAGPEPRTLPELRRRVDAVSRRLDAIVPPAGMAQAHDLLQSACRLAATAVSVREEAVTLGSLDRAWSASAAAAGAQLLLAKARDELTRVLSRPRLP